MSNAEVRNPIQPLAEDEHGTMRFKPNKIVQYLLDNGTHDMNSIAIEGFSDDDREQFAQLIGYSLSGFGELNSLLNSLIKGILAVILSILWILVLNKMKNVIFRKTFGQ